MNDRLRAADYEVANIPTHGEAVRLVCQWHYSRSCSNTSTYRHGLYVAGLMGELVGCAVWQPPTKAAALATFPDDWQGVLSLSRLVVAPWLPTNAASFLLGRSMRLIDRQRWPALVTYADTAQGHTGAIYRATNWVEVGEVPAGDTWTGPSGEQRGRKRAGVTMTVEQMRAAGFVRNAAAPKIKFVHIAWARRRG